ncbi:hypothetical protein E6C50_01040 [Flavobacterium supellecticarium]|uniref:Uncharacterized protein n=1 Tax=Flavobacterium supellecticarium TaxID=2565924 RepID=A0A4S4A332_9FLAO|nr:hypothetical protein [Flavobacterium supellecticarium]THF52827.1 hypothetical protein E6C50_01040 [Flavobacterium supellecticarium]
MNHEEIKKKLHQYTGKQSDTGDNGIAKFDKDYNGVRNVCFVMLDGKHIFLNYSYLVAGEYFLEENKITLHFTTHIITLTGKNLENLYQDLMMHMAKIIIVTNDRYSGIATQGDSPIVTGIGIN